jgi:hypothetical protein
VKLLGSGNIAIGAIIAKSISVPTGGGDMCMNLPIPCFGGN